MLTLRAFMAAWRVARARRRERLARIRAGWMDPYCDFCEETDAELYVILVHPRRGSVARPTVACSVCRDDVMATPYAHLIGPLR